jgi:hypothetical protein
MKAALIKTEARRSKGQEDEERTGCSHFNGEDAGEGKTMSVAVLFKKKCTAIGIIQRNQ